MGESTRQWTCTQALQDEKAQQTLDEARALIDICESNLVDESEKIIGAWPVHRVDLYVELFNLLNNQ